MIEIPDHTVIRPIARGAYGEVWLAHNVTGTWRAVKFVKRDTFRDGRPFDREFEGIRRYEPVSRSHEGLVDVLHVGRNDQGGWFYYVMEIADDLVRERDIVPDHYKPCTLSAVLRERTRLTFPECLQLATVLAGALAHLHREGLIHRDVKPSNIIFVHNSPMLADIGLVAEAGESRSFVGTEGFVPREGPGSVQADIYGLGKVLYQALTGNEHTQFPRLPPEWNSLPDREDRLELNEIILRCCDDDSVRRYQTAEELSGHLKLLAGGKSVRRLRKLEERMRFFRWAALVVLGIAALALGFSVYFRNFAQRESALRAEAESRLLESSVARARAARASTLAGDRLAGLQAIREGVSVKATAELRDNALALLTHPDLRRRWEHTVPDRSRQYVYADVRHRRYIQGPEAGNLVLRSLDDHRVLKILPHPSTPTGQWRAVFSPDGNWIAYTHPAQPLHLIHVETGRKFSPGIPLSNEGTWAALVDFSTDSKTVVWFANADTIVITDIESGNEIRKLQIQGANGHRVKISPDGKRLAFACTGGHVHVIDSTTGVETHKASPEGPLRDFIWTDDSRSVALVTFNGGVELWHFYGPSPSLLRRLNPIEGAGLLNLCWVGGNDIIAATGWGGWTFLISLTEGRVICRDLTAGDDLAYHENTLVVHDWGRQILTQFDCRRNGILRTLVMPLGGHHRPAFSPEGKLLAAPGNPAVNIWKFPPGRGAVAEIETLRHEVVAVRFPGDGTLSAYGLGPERKWDLAPDGTDRPLMNPRDAGSPMLGSAAFSADGRRAVSVASGRLLFFEDGKQMREWKLQSANGALSDMGTYVAITPDGRLAAAGPYNFGRWWIFDTAKKEPVLQGDGEGGAGISFSPDGRWFAVGDGSNVTVYETGQMRVIHRWPRASGIRIRTLPSWSPDGRLISFSRSIDEVFVAKTDSWNEGHTLTIPGSNAFGQSAFSPDSRYVVAGSTLRTMTVWDLAEIEVELSGMGL